MSRIDVSPSLVQVLCLWLPCGVHSVYQLSQQAIGRRYGESRIGAALLAVGVTPRLPLAKIHPRRGGISHKQKGAARAVWLPLGRWSGKVVRFL